MEFVEDLGELFDNVCCLLQGSAVEVVVVTPLDIMLSPLQVTLEHLQ